MVDSWDDGTLPDWSDSHACVNFVNTVDPRVGSDGRDWLPDYAALVDWARVTAAVPEEDLEAARAASAADPPRAARCHREAIRLREALYRVLRAAATGQGPRPPDIDAIRRAAEGLARQRVLSWNPAHGATGWRWAWQRTDPLRLPIRLVLADALDLLTGDADPCLGMCDAEQCGWLFTDTSKSGTRRWCSMRTCGNRAKTQRYLQRRKEQGGIPG